MAKHRPQFNHRIDEKKRYKFQSVLLLNWPNDLFKKLKKSIILIFWVKIDKAIMLSTNIQSICLKKARTTH